MSPEQTFLDVGGLAGYLNVSESTIRRMIRSKEIRAYKVGGTWKFKLEDVEEYLEQRSNASLL